MGVDEKRIFICGIFFIFISIFIVSANSTALFIGLYSLGVFITFISVFFGIQKLDRNSIGKIIFSVGLVLVMIGMFHAIGLMQKSTFLNLQMTGSAMMLIGSFLKK